MYNRYRTEKSMNITLEEKQRLEDLYQTLLHDEKVQNMKNIPMHRGSNCYYHSFKVAKRARKRALKHRQNLDLNVVLFGAILHDYYLYDWRTDKTKKKHHGSQHPYIAASQAKRDFNISPEVEKIIKSHMWPLNIKEYPNSREAKVLSYADKTVAIEEAITSKRYKKKREQKYINHISFLFDETKK